MRMPPVSPIDSTKSTDKTRESFARSVNRPFVPRTSQSGRLPCPPAQAARARSYSSPLERRAPPEPVGAMPSSPARGAGEVQEEAPDDVGFRALAGLLAQVNRLLERVGGFVFFAHSEEHVSEMHPARGVALVERASFAERDGRAAQLALSTQLLGSHGELLRAIGDDRGHSQLR